MNERFFTGGIRQSLLFFWYRKILSYIRNAPLKMHTRTRGKHRRWLCSACKVKCTLKIEGMGSWRGFAHFIQFKERRYFHGQSVTDWGGAPWILYDSDGKPCSGVRGSQQASTDLPRFFHFLGKTVLNFCAGKCRKYRLFSLYRKGAS